MIALGSATVIAMAVITALSIHRKNFSKHVLLTCICFCLVSRAPPTYSFARSTFPGFQRMLSFSCAFCPPIDMRERSTRGTISSAYSDRNERNFRKTHCLSMVIGIEGPPGYQYHDSDDNSDEKNQGSSAEPSSEFETALAIVPPLEDWDNLQRARHFARDPVLLEWPPAIRLFHPFDKSVDRAFDVAQVIEDLDLEPFEITLDTWVIIPNLEETQMQWEDQQAMPDIVGGKNLDSSNEKFNHEHDEEVQNLIEAEERKGNARKKSDNGRNRKKEEGSWKAKRKKSPGEIRNEQRKSIEDDFGPCVLCLEPDEKSREQLLILREILEKALGLPSYFSPSSLYAWEFVDLIDVRYRPLIPISKFDSYQTAIEIAGRLKGLWDPLTINVKCLEVLSCGNTGDLSRAVDDKNGKKLESFQISNEDRFVQQASQVEMKKEQWGCNAKIMLVGEEIQQDEEENKYMAEMLLELGEPGGAEKPKDYTILSGEEERVLDLETWLDSDDEAFDEGVEVIMGRTHFFSGDKRNYKGMPATSVVDSKDRSRGESGSVSGVARRRGSTSRKENVWEDGEYGRRHKDFLP